MSIEDSGPWGVGDERVESSETEVQVSEEYESQERITASETRETFIHERVESSEMEVQVSEEYESQERITASETRETFIHERVESSEMEVQVSEEYESQERITASETRDTFIQEFPAGELAEPVSSGNRILDFAEELETKALEALQFLADSVEKVFVGDEKPANEADVSVPMARSVASSQKTSPRGSTSQLDSTDKTVDASAATGPHNSSQRRGQLRIALLNARDLRGSDFPVTERQDPFVKLAIKGAGKFKSRVDVEGGKHPEWDQSFTFKTTREGEKLQLECWDKHPKLGLDEFIGMQVIPVSSLMDAHGESVWFPIRGRRRRSPQCGEVRLGVEFLPEDVEGQSSLRSDAVEATSEPIEGEKGRIELLLKRARDLAVGDWSKQTLPFCKLRAGGKSVRSAVDEKGDVHPSWEQAFVFPWNSTSEKDNVLAVECWDHRVNGNGFIGMAKISLDHLLATAGQPVWHKLKGRKVKSKYDKGEVMLKVDFIGKSPPPNAQKDVLAQPVVKLEGSHDSEKWHQEEEQAKNESKENSPNAVGPAEVLPTLLDSLMIAEKERLQIEKDEVESLAAEELALKGAQAKVQAKATLEVVYQTVLQNLENEEQNQSTSQQESATTEEPKDYEKGKEGESVEPVEQKIEGGKSEGDSGNSSDDSSDSSDNSSPCTASSDTTNEEDKDVEPDVPSKVGPDEVVDPEQPPSEIDEEVVEQRSSAEDRLGLRQNEAEPRDQVSSDNPKFDTVQEEDQKTSREECQPAEMSVRFPNLTMDEWNRNRESFSGDFVSGLSMALGVAPCEFGAVSAVAGSVIAVTSCTLHTSIAAAKQTLLQTLAFPGILEREAFDEIIVVSLASSLPSDSVHSDSQSEQPATGAAEHDSDAIHSPAGSVRPEEVGSEDRFEVLDGDGEEEQSAGILKLVVNRCKDLENTAERTGRRQDPYVKVRVGSERFRSNIDRDGCTHPVWNQSFYIQVQDPSKTVQVEVWDRKKVARDGRSRDIFLGRVEIPLMKLTSAGRSAWWRLQTHRSRKESIGRGKICLSADYYPGSATEQSGGAFTDGSRSGRTHPLVPPVTCKTFGNIKKIVKHLKNAATPAGLLEPAPIVVVGLRGSGKSCLLSALSGLYLPFGEGGCTRCPMEINLRQTRSLSADTVPVQKQMSYHPPTRPRFPPCVSDSQNSHEEHELADWFEETQDWRAKVSYVAPGHSETYVQMLQKPSELYHALEDVQKFACEKERDSFYTSTAITVDILGPKVVDLSIVDLPGLSRDPSTREIVTEYINRKGAFVVACMAADDADLDRQQGIVKFISRHSTQPLDGRVVAVLTKTDRIDPKLAHAYRKMLKSRDALRDCKSIVPYFATKCGITSHHSHSRPVLPPPYVIEASELELFRSEQEWKSHPNQRQIGSWSLKRHLAEQVDHTLRRKLPKMKKLIAGRREDIQSELAGMRPGLARDDIAAMTKTLFSLVAQFDQRLKDEVIFGKAAESPGAFFEPLDEVPPSPSNTGLRARIDQQFQHFWTEILAVKPDFDGGFRSEGRKHVWGDPTGESPKTSRNVIYVEHVKRLLDEESESSDLLSASAVSTGSVSYRLVQEFVRQWRAPAMECMVRVREFVQVAIIDCVFGVFGHFPKLEEFVRRACMERLEKEWKETEGAIESLLDMEARPFALNRKGLLKLKDRYLDDYKRCVSAVKGCRVHNGANSPSSSTTDDEQDNQEKRVLAEARRLGFDPDVYKTVQDIETEHPGMVQLIRDKMLPRHGQLERRAHGRPGRRELPVAELQLLQVLASVKAYYNIACRRFSDNIPMTLNFRLVVQPLRRLREELMPEICSAGNLTPETMTELFTQDGEQESRREQLLSQLQALQQAEDALRAL